MSRIAPLHRLLLVGLLVAASGCDIAWVDSPVQPTPTWKSGASGAGVANGSLGRWRGRQLDIAGTWNDNYESQSAQWSVQDGFEFEHWRRDLDVAVGAIYKDRGESWQAAADGAYDERWREALESLATAWKGKPGTLFIRFAHEFNGDWYPWSVTGQETEDFIAAWKRFRAIQQDVLPRHSLVFSVNSETTDALDLDWRAAFPGGGQADVVSVDYYNDYLWVNSAKAFEAALLREDDHGAPVGLEAHRRFAERVGLPFAVSEWSTNAEKGDAREFIEQVYVWMSSNAGTGAGNLLYEIQFNVASYGDAKFRLDGESRQPRAAAAYRELW